MVSTSLVDTIMPGGPDHVALNESSTNCDEDVPDTPLPDTRDDPNGMDEWMELFHANVVKSQCESIPLEPLANIPALQRVAEQLTSQNPELIKIHAHNVTQHRGQNLTEEEVESAMSKRAIRAVNTIMECGKELLKLLTDNERKSRPIPNYEEKIRIATAIMDRRMEVEFSNLDVERIKVNKARAPPLQFNWDDVADSVYPTEKIKAADAPPAPKNVREMLLGRFSKYFLRAMMVEIESLKDKEVWDEVSPPPGQHVIQSKWVFDYKTDPMGFIERFKARLVAVGSSQVENKDYTVTHSPVVKLKAIRILLAMSALFGIPIDQIDVETAFLYGDLKETNYMRLPQGFEKYTPSGKALVARLKKALYGLHQSGREWYFTFRDYMISEGFEEFKSESCAYAKMDPESKQLIIVLVYVDDILIASNDKSAISRTKAKIRERFNIKDMGSAQWILKVQIKKIDEGILLCQSQYVIETLKLFEMWDIPTTKWKDSPMRTDWEHDDSSPQLDETRNGLYTTLVAKLIYLSQLTRPDIMYTVNTLAQFQRPARECDWKAGLRLLCYLRKTYDWGLYYKPDKSNRDVIVFKSERSDLRRTMGVEIPEGFYPRMATDASYGQEFDRKSRSAYCFMVFGCLVSWYSKKQATTALSSTEAEINAVVEGIKEAEWMQVFLRELGFAVDEPIVSEQDNQSVIAIAANPIHHARIKHIEVKTYYIREKIENKLVKLVYCPTEMMVADLLTKALPSTQHNNLCAMIGMRSMSALENHIEKNVRLSTRLYQ